MIWWHWSSSGRLVSDPLHAGTLGAAQARRTVLEGIDWDRSPLFPEHWRCGPHSRLYRLALTEPLANPDAPVLDHEVYDYPDVPVLYVNASEAPGDLSVRAPLRCWREVG